METFDEFKKYVIQLKDKYGVIHEVYSLEKGKHMGLCEKDENGSKLFLYFEPIFHSFYASMYQIDMSIEDFIEFLFLHELGHAEDKKSLKFTKKMKKWDKISKKFKNKKLYYQITKEIVLLNEQRAWDFARRKIDLPRLRPLNQVERKIMKYFRILLSKDKIAI